MSAAAPQLRLWTREEYYKMIEAGVLRPDERVELIGGRIFSVKAQRPSQSTAISLTAEILRSSLDPSYHIRVRGPLDLNSYSQPEPDIAVVRGAVRDYAKAHPTRV